MPFDIKRQTKQPNRPFKSGSIETYQVLQHLTPWPLVTQAHIVPHLVPLINCLCTLTFKGLVGLLLMLHTPMRMDVL